MSVSVGPHDWHELKPTLRERIHGYVPRCEACYAPKDAHPAHGWNEARPYRDRQPPYVRAWLKSEVDA
jgi:hypothetical protein